MRSVLIACGLALAVLAGPVAADEAQPTLNEQVPLKGLEKVKTEWGLVCIAHTMRKLAG